MGFFRVLALTWLLASPVWAQNISILPVKNEAGDDVRKQLLKALCEEFECVSPSKVADERSPDWEKARKLKVSLFIGIAVAGKPDKQKTQLSFITEDQEPKKKVFPLSEGVLSERNVNVAVKLTRKVLKEKSDERERPPPGRERDEDEPEKPEEPAAAPPKPGSEPLLIFEAGSDVFSRRFSFTQVQTPNLRSYSANVIASPRVGVEYLPLAGLKNAASGLGLRGDFSHSVGLKSNRKDGPSHPTSLMRWEIAALYRIRFFKDSELSVTPVVGLRQTSFSVGEASDGTVLEGLPQVSYLSIVGGLGGDVPFLKGAIVAFGRFHYLHVLSSGEIFTRAYFPEGSNSGIDAQLGVNLRLMPVLHLRLTGFLTRYGMELNTQPGDTFVATTAVDQYLGGTLSLRYLMY